MKLDICLTCKKNHAWVYACSKCRCSVCRHRVSKRTGLPLCSKCRDKNRPEGGGAAMPLPAMAAA